jgi:LemA protein
MIFVIWAIVFVLGIWLISTYNGLTALRLRLQNAWRQVDVQLKRRYDLIPNLVETVKGYMQYEQDTLQKVIDARSQAMASKGVKESAEAQNALTQSLNKVFALMENIRISRQARMFGPAGRVDDHRKSDRFRAAVL